MAIVCNACQFLTVPPPSPLSVDLPATSDGTEPSTNIGTVVAAVVIVLLIALLGVSFLVATIIFVKKRQNKRYYQCIMHEFGSQRR